MEGPAPLTPEQKRELEEAKERIRPLLKAVRRTRLNTWSLGIAAALTIAFGMSSVSALLLGIGMAVATWYEHRGGALLRRFDPKGPRLLGRNQLGLMAEVVVYALWEIYKAKVHPDADLAQMEVLGGDTAGLITSLTIIMWVAVIATTGLLQGFMARYYFKRGPMAEAYVRDTPAWVIELQRAATLE